MNNTIKMATQKQLDYLLVLGAKIEEIKNLNIKEAGIMIYKLKNGTTTAKKEQKKVEIKHGLKVGDILYAVWGYDQTNYTFFVVSELVGSNSIKIKEVYLKATKENWYADGLACDKTYSLENYAIKEHPTFVKDNVNGDLKRVKKSGYNNEEYVYLSSFADAYKYDGSECGETYWA